MPLTGRPTEQNLSVAERRAALDERRKRSEEEPLDVRPRRVDPYPIMAVRNPLHGTAYLVLLPTYPSPEVVLCTCTDFARRGLGRCKHIEAALRWLKDHPGDRGTPDQDRRRAVLARLWRAIDRAIAARSSDSAPESLAVRMAGRLLFQPAATEAQRRLSKAN